MDRLLQLCYPVTTLDGKELLPVGTHLTSGVMEELVRSAGNKRYGERPLLAHGTIARDLERLCDSPPYSRIFSDPVRRRDIFDTMHRIELVRPLLDVYDHFKAQDPYTYHHSLRVFALSLLLAQEFIDGRSELAMEVAAAPNHDFGKLCVPLAVLNKSTPLNQGERQLLSHHSAAGYVLLSYYLGDPDHPAAVTARDHHERCDGSGYPRGISLRNTIVEIVAVSDVFDALISRRPYRSHSYDLRTALEDLTLQADKGILSTEVVQALILLNRKAAPSDETCRFSREQRGDHPVENNYSGALPCKFGDGND